jgi:hypothetical protein
MEELVKTEEIQKAKEKIGGLLEELKKEITGQTLVIRNIMTCLVAQGTCVVGRDAGTCEDFTRKVDCAEYRFIF